jgi:hypothetical protein
MRLKEQLFEYKFDDGGRWRAMEVSQTIRRYPVDEQRAIVF